MSRLYHRYGGALSRFAFVAILIGGFSLGLLSAR